MLLHLGFLLIYALAPPLFLVPSTKSPGSWSGLLPASAQSLHRGYSSVVPRAAPAPILSGVCNLRAGNPCVAEALCHPSAPIVGEALCTCPRGYGGDGKRQGQGCVNIDECLIGAHTCDSRTQDCIDKPGDYECVCKRGYSLAPDKRTCLDVDECTIPNRNVCDGVTSKCYNLEGSYECRCMKPVTILDERSGKCRDLDECEDKGGVMNPCDQLCTNHNPGVSCGCKPGWTLGPDERSCLDNDECADGTHSCGAFAGAKCQNTEGSFKCICSEEKGWATRQTDPRICDNLNECVAHPYICGGANTCCGDLMPPERFACMLPLSSAALATLHTPHASSSLGSPVGGFANAAGAVGPAAGTMQALAANRAAAAAASSPPPPPQTHARGSQFYGAGAQSEVGDWGCLEENIQYVGWDIKGSVGKADSARACQSRCQGDPGCDYFSFKPDTTECFLKASNFGRSPGAGFVSGPKFCVNLAQAPPVPQWAAQPAPPTTMGLLGSVFGRYLQGTSTAEVSVVVAGDKTPEQVQQELLASGRRAESGAPRRLQRLGGLLGVGRLTSSLMPRLSTTSSQCPKGFDYAQDLYRTRVRQQTVQTIQTAIVGSVNPDGTTTPGLTPETFTDGLVRNTNLLANRMASWYGEIATVPGEVVAATGQASAGGFMNPLGGAFPIPPEAAALGAVVGTGLVVAGIDKAIYGNGPGDSLVLDRTGLSKKMAYGLV
eukprot:GHVS01004742.1.p1 GENE.GHVS01004742.1~~GHVS01004742.1.p1  ORF type:complete len:718 (+),score=102.52 GHVS01004742.1:209-2362(+)